MPSISLSMENPHNTLLVESSLLSLYTLKTAMEEIIHSDNYNEDEKRSKSPRRRKSMSDLKQKLDCELSLIKSEFLSDCADLTFSAYRNVNSVLTTMNDDETALKAEEKYFEKLKLYFTSYRANCFAAFAYIPKVLEYILEIERMRQGYKKDLYEPSHNCQALIPTLMEIIQQEKERITNRAITHINSARKERKSVSFIVHK